MEEAIEHQVKALELDPNRPLALEFLGNHYRELVRVLTRQRLVKEAEQLVRKQLASARAWAATDEKSIPVRVYLARSYENVGRVQLQLNQPAETEAAFREASLLFRGLVAEVPTNAEYASKLGTSLNDWALALNMQKRFAEMIPLLDEAIEAQERAVQAQPTNRYYQQYLCNHFYLRAEARVGIGEHAFVLSAASAVRERFPAPLEDVSLGWAAVLARCIPLVEKDSKLGADERTRLAEVYAQEAMTFLQAAQRKKSTLLPVIHTEPAFAPLRNRPDFQKLLGTVPKPGK